MESALSSLVTSEEKFLQYLQIFLFFFLSRSATSNLQLVKYLKRLLWKIASSPPQKTKNNNNKNNYNNNNKALQSTFCWSNTNLKVLGHLYLQKD